MVWGYFENINFDPLTFQELARLTNTLGDVGPVGPREAEGRWQINALCLWFRGREMASPLAPSLSAGFCFVWSCFGAGHQSTLSKRQKMYEINAGWVAIFTLLFFL